MITANDIVKANEVLKNVVERTPLDFDRYLSEKYGEDRLRIRHNRNG